jgi:hypothetical protein
MLRLAFVLFTAGYRTNPFLDATGNLQATANSQIGRRSRIVCTARTRTSTSP